MPSVISSGLGVLGALSDAVAVAAAGIAGWVTYRTARGRNPLLERVLRAERRRCLGPCLAAAGISASSLRRECRRHARAVAQGDGLGDVQTELAWLDSLARDEVPGYQGPLVVRGMHPDVPAATQLHDLATAYERLGVRLRGRGLLAPSPLIGAASDLAAATSGHLRSQAYFATSPPVAVPGGRLELDRCGFTLELLETVESGRADHGIDAVTVTHVRERLVVPGLPAAGLTAVDRVRALPAPVTPDEVARLTARLRGKSFDGVLPSLRSRQRQYDLTSGRTRLHLELAETTYSAVLLTHYVGSHGAGRSAESLLSTADQAARLLTLSLLPVSADGYLLLARRSRGVGVGAYRLSPAVNGNLEMRDRLGVAVDRGPDGAPDPVRALCREAAEEMGLVVAPDDVQVLGLTRVSYSEEVAVSVLVATVSPDQTAEELAAGSVRADRVEGRWELEGEFLALPVGDGPQHRDELLAWTLTSADQVPHVPAVLIAWALPALADDLGFDAALDHLRRLAAGPVAPLPTGTVMLHRDGRPSRSASSGSA
ncbi:MAG: hypothetical protein QOE01_2146 [Actinomycetota bacterium]|nr:hypothetical protein [Actinomycetota bacterium]